MPRQPQSIARTFSATGEYAGMTESRFRLRRPEGRRISRFADVAADALEQIRRAASEN